jgi:hypothetical protein
MSPGMIQASKKATDWCDIKIVNSPKQTRLPWYQSIHKKHIWVYVKLDSRLSNPARSKMRSKKMWVFPSGWSALFLNVGVWKHLNLCTIHKPWVARLTSQSVQSCCHGGAFEKSLNIGFWWKTESSCHGDLALTWLTDVNFFFFYKESPHSISKNIQAHLQSLNSL